MNDKEQRLKAMIHIVMCQWLNKNFSVGYVIHKTIRYTVPHGNPLISTQYHIEKKYKFFSTDLLSFCNVMKAVIMTGTAGELETVVIDSLVTLIKKIFSLNDVEAGEIVADFFQNSKYIDLLALIIHEQLLYYPSNDYEM